MRILCELNDENVLGRPGRSEQPPRLTARAIVKTRHGRYAVMYAEKFGLYSLPGGGVEPGEDVEAALRREILEETGCHCESLEPLGRVLENRACLDYTQDSHYFVVTVSAPGEAGHLTAAEQASNTAVQWYPLEEVFRLIAAPEHETVQRKYLQARDVAALRAYQDRLLRNVLEKLNVCGTEIRITPFLNEEDGEEYAVWKVEDADRTYVLKRAKADELSIYQRFLRGYDFAPQFYGAAREGTSDYFLMEYTVGTDLCKCERQRLTQVLDALIASQRAWWDCGDDYGYGQALQRRISRGNYLNDPELEAAYARFLELFQTVPRTLCHDDLLPFNVLAGERAVIIDWEVAGILPYPTALARLIAHGAEDPEELFYMSAADRSFAIDYYYAHLIREQGIAYGEYRKTLDHFLLFEYCEWIMLGNKYDDADPVRFAHYSKLAKEFVRTLK